MDNYLNKENEPYQVRLVELANEYVVELPIQQKIQDAIFDLKKKRFDKRIGRWVISKEDKDKFSKTMKPLGRICVSKVGNKKYLNPEIELKIKNDEDTFTMAMVNFNDLPQLCKSLLEDLKKVPSRQYDFETKFWSFNNEEKELFNTTIQAFSKAKAIKVKIDDWQPLVF